VRRVAITGAGGFLAWHLRCRLHALGWEPPLLLDRETWSDARRRRDRLRQVDAVVHLAGVNRANPEEVKQGNVNLARELVDALKSSGVKPQIVYASTTHIERDSAYGVGKRHAAEILGEWAAGNGAAFTNLVIPHVFGEQCRPFYNSATATFCYQIANGLEPAVENNAQLELLHAQDVCTAIMEAVEERTDGSIRLNGHPITVVEALDKIRVLDATYRNDIIPDVRDRFTLQLFNTYRGYLFPRHYPVRLKLHTDDRGSLFEAVKGDNGGQAFLSTTKPGNTRGDHYHINKIERFLVVEGHAAIRIRKLFSDEVHEFDVSGKEPVYIDMPTLHTHNITNTGPGTLLTMFWSHEIFDPKNPDTIRDPVQQKR
jgi:UDP-2-acetamido-2,6-beta-L-arabino-hexul-4-ose reductase